MVVSCEKGNEIWVLQLAGNFLPRKTNYRLLEKVQLDSHKVYKSFYLLHKAALIKS